MTDLNDAPQMPQNPYATPGGPQGPTGQSDRESNKDARTWAMFAHLAAFSGFVLLGVGFVVGPLVVWLLKKEQFPFVDEQGKEAVNFQITMLIYGLASWVLLIIPCIGWIVPPAIGIVDIVFTIIATIKANDGIHFRYPYPLIIRFIK